MGACITLLEKRKELWGFIVLRLTILNWGAAQRIIQLYCLVRCNSHLQKYGMHVTHVEGACDPAR